MSVVSFEDILRVDRTPATDKDVNTSPYVGLEHIEKNTGHFESSFSGVPESFLSSKFKFTEDHVLYGKLRPYLSKVVLPDFAGVCTTEILPLLPIQEKLNRSFLYYSLLSSRFVSWASRNVAGANLPRLDPGRLLEYELFLPCLNEQNLIASTLSCADHLRRTRRYARRMSDDFLQSVFKQMFADWLKPNAETTLSEILKMPLSNGIFEKNEEYGVTGTPVIWVDNLYHTISINTQGLRRVKASGSVIKKYEVDEDDLLFTRSSLVREGIGQTNIVPATTERMMFECHIIRARADQTKACPHYLLGLYRSEFGRKSIMQAANTATMTTISQDGIGGLPCPLPPIEKQREFKKVVQRFVRLRAQQLEAERQAEHLFQTLLNRAFAVDTNT